MEAGGRITRWFQPYRSIAGVAAFVALALHVVASVLYALSDEPKPLYLIVLLSLPMIYVLVSAVLTTQFFHTSYYTVTPFSLVTSTLLIVYCREKGPHADFFSFLWWACLVLVLLLVVLVYWLMGIIVKDGKAKTVGDLLAHPRMSISCFLVLFLQATIFLTFALVFRDYDGKSLHAEYADFYTDTQTTNELQKGEGPKDPSGPRGGDKAPDGLTPGTVKRFWFARGSADSGLLSRFWMSDRLTANECNSINPECIAKNCQTLAAVLDEIRTNPGGSRQILVGHADDVPVNGTKYRSNFELSLARALHVKFLLDHFTDRLAAGTSSVRHSRDSDLAIIAASNEPAGFLSKDVTDGNPCEEITDPKQAGDGANLVNRAGLSVEIASLNSRQIRRLTLLDYLYFMMYTVTTTGYGDIIPISAEAKFLTTVGNLIELLFLVVFFNVLVSRSKE
jgi:hypothetical protein